MQSSSNGSALEVCSTNGRQRSPRGLTILNIIRIITAAALLTGWCHLVPAHAAPGASQEDSVIETTCPLRAWPYIG
ncbi:hypothetical protein, partial [Methylobacterium crusticola]|uniref:hypothetical protein n=1 Tax=Methylobacterium crusticola TaxID=1697972 RepID=UPI00193AA2C5